jgi:hypothetical protein
MAVGGAAGLGCCVEVGEFVVEPDVDFEESAVGGQEGLEGP